MKLAFVELAGFRGFKDKTRFDLPEGFVVLTGRNGVGKSTVLDAVDFVLTGTINKYAIKGAKGGGLDDHIWWVGDGEPDSHYVTIGFVNKEGEEFVVTRSREHGVDKPSEEIARWLCDEHSSPQSWPDILMQSTLIRDEYISGLSFDLPEQARFASVRAAIGGLTGPDHTQRTNAILSLANTAKAEQETRIKEAQAQLGQTLSALTEARSVAERQSDVAVAQQIIETLEPNLTTTPGDRAEVLRSRIADRKQSIPILMDALTRAETLRADFVRHESDEGQAEIVAASEELKKAQLSKEQADQALALAARLEAAERESDELTSHMLALMDHGQAVGLQDDHCPLCAAVRTSEEFAEAIAAAKDKLKERGARAANAREAAQQALLKSEQAIKVLMAAEDRSNGLTTRRTNLNNEVEVLSPIFRNLDLAFSLNELEATRRSILKRREETAQLERALYLLEASAAHDRVAALEVQVERFRIHIEEEMAKLSIAERAVDVARKINNAAQTVGNQILTEQFDTVMPLLKELYRRLRPHTDWQEIGVDFGGRVRASLNLSVGDGRNPQFLFSSGQRRAAGIAFLLAIHLSRPWCRWRTLLLDDPVQHIDDYRALNLVEVLSAIRHTGRQIIISIEDPALAEVLCRRLRSTTTEAGRQFELRTANNGSATIANSIDVFPFSRSVLHIAEAS